MYDLDNNLFSSFNKVNHQIHQRLFGVCVGWDDVNFGTSNEGISVSVMHVEHLVWTHAAWCYTCFHFLVSNKSSQSAVSFAAMRLTHCVQSSIAFGGWTFSSRMIKEREDVEEKGRAAATLKDCVVSLFGLSLTGQKAFMWDCSRGLMGCGGQQGLFISPLQHSQAHQLSA